MFRAALLPRGNITFTCRTARQREHVPLMEGTARDGRWVAGPGRVMRGPKGCTYTRRAPRPHR